MDRRAIAFGAGIVAVGLALTGCGGGASRAKSRYYDPRGYFSAHLPSENWVEVLPPEQGSPAILTGVVSRPEQEAQPPVGGFGGIAAQTQGDRTVYLVYALDAAEIDSLDELALLHLSDPTADLKDRRSIAVAGRNGLLVVADHEADTGDFSVASGFLLDGELAYWIISAFPIGEWKNEQADFFEVLRSFQTQVPPGVPAIPLPAASS